MGKKVDPMRSKVFEVDKETATAFRAKTGLYWPIYLDKKLFELPEGQIPKTIRVEILETQPQPAKVPKVENVKPPEG